MPRARCPQCKKPIQWQGNPHRPFCSERCKLIDLGKWMTEEHRIAGEPDDTTSEIEETDKKQGR